MQPMKNAKLGGHLLKSFISTNPFSSGGFRLGKRSPKSVRRGIFVESLEQRQLLAGDLGTYVGDAPETIFASEPGTLDDDVLSVVYNSLSGSLEIEAPDDVQYDLLKIDIDDAPNGVPATFAFNTGVANWTIDNENTISFNTDVRQGFTTPDIPGFDFFASDGYQIGTILDAGISLEQLQAHLTIEYSVAGVGGNALIGDLIYFASVNQAPSFTQGPDRNVSEDAGAQLFPEWATDISPGGPAEVSQSVEFIVAGNTNTDLFSVQPAVAAETGDLTFTPAPNASGTAEITLLLEDDGGVENGGQSFSLAHRFNISVTPVADAANLIVGPSRGAQDTAIGVNISATLVDNDGSETMSIMIDDVPDGVIFSSGIDNNDGSWTFTQEELVGLALLPVAGSDDDFALTVIATTTETDNGDTATRIDRIAVNVTPALKQATFSIPEGIVADPGTTVEIPIHIGESAVGWQGFNITVRYNTDKLDLSASGVLKGAMLDATGGWVLSKNVQDGDGTALLAVFRSSPTTVEAGEVLKLRFDVRADATLGEMVIDLDGRASFGGFQYTYQDGALVIGEVVAAAPQITGVTVASSSWTSEFNDGLGYSLTGGAEQLVSVPFENLDTISVTFDQDMEIGFGDAMLRGVNVPAYTLDPTSFNYDAGTFTATWKLDSAVHPDGITNDKLALIVNDSAHSTLGINLDGEWQQGTSSFPSGNGAEGGRFVFRYDVLVGDANGSGIVDVRDVQLLREAAGSNMGSAAYFVKVDFDGNATIDARDIAPLRNNLLERLPTGEPAIPTLALLAEPVFATEASDDISSAVEVGIVEEGAEGEGLETPVARRVGREEYFAALGTSTSDIVSLDLDDTDSDDLPEEGRISTSL